MILKTKETYNNQVFLTTKVFSKLLYKTNFCNKKVDNVVSNTMKKFIIEDMKLKTSLTPSSRYAKIFNSQYSKNLNNPHIFCIKTYGSPYLLYLTKVNNVNYSLLIDKKTKSGHDYPKMFIERVSDQWNQPALVLTIGIPGSGLKEW